MAKKTPFIQVIHDAEKGTPAWFHEERHGWQQQHFKAIAMFGSFSNYALVSCFFLVYLMKFFGYQFLDVVFGLLLIWLVFDSILEADAHVYAIRRTSFWRWLDDAKPHV